MKNKWCLVRVVLALTVGAGFILSNSAWAQTPSTADPNVKAYDDFFKTLKPGQEFAYIGDMGFRVSTLKAWRDYLASPRVGTRGAFDYNPQGPLGTVAAPKWTNGRVPFIFDNTFDSQPTLKKRFTDGIFEWQKVANVRWVPKQSGDSNWVRVVYNNNSVTMNSYIGMVGSGGPGSGSTGEQILNIDNTASTLPNGLFRCTHEVGHCLGMIHEQCRSDRNTYVTIVSTSGSNNALTNINWAIVPGSVNTTSTYDYDSLMHYPANGSVVSGGKTYSATITPKEPFYSNAGSPTLNQETHMGAFDGAAMSAEYGNPCFISGKVMDSAGNGLPGAVITCAGTGESVYYGPGSTPITTDVTGTYLIPGVVTGTYDVSVSLVGRGFKPKSVTVGTSGVTGVNFTVSPVISRTPATMGFNVYYDANTTSDCVKKRNTSV